MGYMRLLIVSQYFWPESFRINDLARCLSEQGESVTVLTGVPNYPEGEIFEGYSRRSPIRQSWNGVEVVRVPLVPRKQGRALQLIANYVSFVFFGATAGVFRLRRKPVDAIVVYGISPILQAIPAIVLKWVKGAKLAVWVQDLWPETLEATGFVKNPVALKMVGWIVRWIYHRADVVLVQSRAFIEPVSKLCPADRIVYYPNAGEDIFSREEVEGECAVPDLDRYFSVVFAGTLGTAQALDVILDAAERLRGESQIMFFLIGLGSRAEWVQSEVQRRGLANVTMPGRFPVDRMPAIFRKAGALLVTLTDAPIFAQTIPSKVQSYLAAGKPILGSINGEGARVIEESRSGLTSNAMDAPALADNVLHMSRMSAEQREVLGKNGKMYFMENFESRKLAMELIEKLGNLIT
jgi:glycosyltransferase involved in cell wall biosynthesis